MCSAANNSLMSLDIILFFFSKYMKTLLCLLFVSLTSGFGMVGAEICAGSGRSPVAIVENSERELVTGQVIDSAAEMTPVQSPAIAETNESVKRVSALESALTYNNLTGLVADCADPYVLKYNGKYYLYGTGGADGIKVYQSDNMVTWSRAVGATSGYALHKDAVWGDKWFWAPEVYYLNGKFYMFFSAEEELCVAESSSPLGPFTQSAENQKPFHTNVKEIDSHLFIDEDGKKYMYFVRFTNGNEIWVAELNDDLRSIKESTLRRCIGASNGLQTWEQSTLEPYPGSKVNEGPFILKHNGWYYLTYSANHYQNPNYGVGYATSKSPLGPWNKYTGNPILIGNSEIRGVGHHSFVNVSDGCQYIVYHSHKNTTTVQPRKLAIDLYGFIPATIKGYPDVLKVYGPTTTPQTLCNNGVSDVAPVNAANQGIKLFPNPATSQISIELEDVNKECTVSIYNTNGELVFNKIVTSSKTVVDTQNFSKGAYLVKIDNGSYKLSEKLIIL